MNRFFKKSFYRKHFRIVDKVFLGIFLLVLFSGPSCVAARMTAPINGFDERPDYPAIWHNEKYLRDIIVEFKVDSRSNVLGAYEILIEFDPNVVRIEEVTGGKNKCFSSQPAVSEKSFDSGSCKIAAFQTDVNALSDEVSVATVRFVPVAAGRTSIRTTLQVCSDPLGNKISAEAFSSQSILIVR